MATVGQPLTAPEVGWKRYDDTNNFIAYVGKTWIERNPVTGSNPYNDTLHWTSTENDYYCFNFTGTKLRIIGVTVYDGSTQSDVYIDGTLVGLVNHYAPSNAYQTLDIDISGLANTKHYCKVINRATGGKGGFCYLDAIDIDVNEFLLSLINLTTTAGNSQVALSWNVVDGAISYNIKRSTTAGGPYTTIATNVIGTSYVDNTVINGTTYYYVVTAVDGSGNESGNSNEASATPQAPSGHALLRVTMIDSSEREYRLSTSEIDDFINWYTRTIGTGISCYALNDIVDLSKEYLSFEKIISFKVILLKD